MILYGLIESGEWFYATVVILITKKIDNAFKRSSKLLDLLNVKMLRNSKRHVKPLGHRQHRRL